MIHWYYGTQDNQQCGPVDRLVILEKLRNNELNRDSFVWREGMEQWQRLWAVMSELEPPVTALNHPTVITPKDAPSTQSITPTNTTGRYSTASSHIGRSIDKDTGDTGISHNDEDKSATSPYAAPASPLISDDVVIQGKEEVIYAGFWRRVAAYLVDTMLVGTVSQVLGGAIGFIGGMMMAASPNQDEFSVGQIMVMLLSFAVSLGLGIFYYAWFHSSQNAATPGKLLVGIKVVRPNGERISFLRGIGRFFASYLSGFFFCIGYIMAAFTDRKQALHDMLCDTWVVDKYAFTHSPQLQQRGLGTATIVILSITGLLLIMAFIGIIIAIGILMKTYNG